MKYVIIKSKRRNPNQNPKIYRNNILEKLYTSGEKYYISFTVLPKIGINPYNEFDTPIGIYTYPLNDIYHKILDNDVPFASDRPYIQVIKPKNENSILYGNEYNKEQYKQDLKKLGIWYKKHKDLINKKSITRFINNDHLSSKKNLSENGIIPLLDDKGMAWSNLVKYANYCTEHPITNKQYTNITNPKPIQLLWSITRLLAIFTTSNNQKSTTRWNTIIRYLGYNIVEDDGLGFIHPNEPIQAVFLSKDSFDLIKTIDNRNNIIPEKGLERYTPFENIKDEATFEKYCKINESVKYLKTNKANGLKLTYNGVQIKIVGTTPDTFLTTKRPISNFTISINCDKVNLNNCEITSIGNGKENQFIKESIINNSGINGKIYAINCEINKSKIMSFGDLFNCNFSNTIINSGRFNPIYTFDDVINKQEILEFINRMDNKTHYSNFVNCIFNSDRIKVFDATFTNCKIDFSIDRGIPVKLNNLFNNCKFINCSIKLNMKDKSVFNKCTFKKCNQI